MSCSNTYASSRITLFLSRESSTINALALYVCPISRSLPFPSVHQPLYQTDQWLLVMSTQLIGYSIGGICAPILVTPSSMIWPYLLAYAAIFNTLHSQETNGDYASGGISRARFFTYVFVGYLIYSQFLFIYFPTLEICIVS